MLTKSKAIILTVIVLGSIGYAWIAYQRMKEHTSCQFLAYAHAYAAYIKNNDALPDSLASLEQAGLIRKATTYRFVTTTQPIYDDGFMWTQSYPEKIEFDPFNFSVRWNEDDINPEALVIEPRRFKKALRDIVSKINHSITNRMESQQ